MKLGIMQPYFVPYIGYWQLMNAVDNYVIYDDVTFIKNGWINRNRILIGGQPHYFNLPTIGAGSNVLIKDVQLNPDQRQFDKLLKTLEMAYRKAPFYDETMTVLAPVLVQQTTGLADYLANQIRAVAQYLGMKTHFLVSSREVSKDSSLHAQDKVLDICRSLGATEYYNAIGGQELYDCQAFAEHGVSLHFVKTKDITYRQFKNDFVSNLSIIDVMMFNSAETVREMLLQYELI